MKAAQVYHVNYTIRDGIMKYDPVSAQVLSRCALYTLAHVFVFLLFFFFYEMKNYDIFRGGLFKFLINRN